MYIYRLLIFASIIAGTVYMYFYLKRMLRFWLKVPEKRWLKCILAAAAFLLMLPIINIWGFWTVVILHLICLSILTDLIHLIVTKIRSGKSGRHILYSSGLIPVILTVLILGYGYLNMQQVIKTEYTITTEKDLGQPELKVALISDLHFSTTMTADRLEEYCEQISEDQPDIVVLAGDIVDEGTSILDMQAAFQALGQIQNTDGIYYVYGNHDKGKYSEECEFTEQLLKHTITLNGIHVLEDQSYDINDEIRITGRMDRSDAAIDGVTRKQASELAYNNKKDRFQIMAEHQPRDIAENAEAGYDLMLSGHTHAGQIWPVGLITSIFDKDTVNYGHVKYENMDLLVTSGIAGWGYPVRTGKRCEYVVVNIKPH